MTDSRDDDVSLEEFMARSHEAEIEDLHTSMPGRVESYDASTQLVDVAPMVKRRVRTRDGSLRSFVFPTIRSVPVVIPRWGSWFIHAPLAVGDTVLLVFCERDPARWVRTGEVSDPVDTRLHNLAHAVAITGVYPRTKALASGSTPSNALVLGRDGGAVIRVKDNGQIEIGTNAVEFVALANLVKARLDTIQTQYDSHTHQYIPGTAGTASTGPAVPLINALAAVAAQTVKAE
jgi:hypothetical protein